MIKVGDRVVIADQRDVWGWGTDMEKHLYHFGEVARVIPFVEAESHRSTIRDDLIGVRLDRLDLRASHNGFYSTENLDLWWYYPDNLMKVSSEEEIRVWKMIRTIRGKPWQTVE